MVVLPHMGDTVTDLETEGLAGLFQADEVKDREPVVYEVGYHLLPSLSDGEVQAWVKDFTNFLKKHEAVFVGERMPEKIDLAYAIERRVEGRFQAVRTAHFGWVACKLEPRLIAEVKKFMDMNQSVLRFLIITTSVDEVKAVMEGKVIMPKAQSSTEAISAPKRAEEQSAEVSDVDLDKALDSMTDEKEA